MLSIRHVVCPHCGAKNRFPVGRPAEKARCGTCYKALFEGRPESVDAEQFERHRQGDEIAVLVDVWAPWCGPCRIMGPMFERAAAELEPYVRLLWVNADEEPQLAAKLGVRGIPALILMQGGQIVAHTTGTMDTRGIVEWARAHLVAEAA
jgi:thioredoxin 2